MIDLPLPVVDGLELPAGYRRVLQPGESVRDPSGRKRVLPRYFLEIDSWQTALDTRLTENFMLWEFIGVDVREASELLTFPRYVPCAVLLLAATLEVFRREVNTYVHIAANGGYRSPAHRLNRQVSRHCWGTAANIYRIGDDYLDDDTVIGRYADVARRAVPALWIRPFGRTEGAADDHLHVDLGYTVFEPVQLEEGAETSGRK